RKSGESDNSSSWETITKGAFIACLYTSLIIFGSWIGTMVQYDGSLPLEVVKGPVVLSPTTGTKHASGMLE
ncbi:hypothetical protein L208DRAFT_1267947, partial [Tricholoma matsutake]